MTTQNAVPGTGGERYVPYEERDGAESVVFFTRDLSPEGLRKIYDKISGALTGKIAVKLHTGEPKGPNIIPREWVKELFAQKLDENASIIETNTYYEGGRYTTDLHLKTLELNGWTFCPVDITDAEGTAELPVDGKWFDHMTVGKDLLNYDSMLTLTHFKGHLMGGFGGSNKNIGIGCADGRIGKKAIHTVVGSSNLWSIAEEELMERITESTKATLGFFGENVAFINVMRNMSVSCDCEGTAAEPVVTPDVGILASLDILAVDQACMDLVYSLPEHASSALRERVETRHGHRQLSYMKEMEMGNNRYKLIDIDNGDIEITQKEAVAHAGDTWIPDSYNTFPQRAK